MVLDPIPQSLPVHFFGSRPQPPTSPPLTCIHLVWHGVVCFFLCLYVSFDVYTSLLMSIRLFWCLYVSFDTYPQPHDMAPFSACLFWCIPVSCMSHVCLFWCIYVSFKRRINIQNLKWRIDTKRDVVLHFCMSLLYVTFDVSPSRVSFDVYTSLLKRTHSRMLVRVIALYTSPLPRHLCLFWHTHISFETHPQPHARGRYCSILLYIRLFCHDICKSLLTYTHLFWHIPAAACSCVLLLDFATMSLWMHIRLFCHDIYVSFDIHASLLTHTRSRMLVQDTFHSRHNT